MKIGFYKLGITKDMIDLKQDKNGRFKELLALVKIFANQGHDTYMLDKNSKIEGFHKIYVLNGVINVVEHCKELEYLRQNTLQLNYILTDLRLICDEIVPYFNIIYTQSIKPIKSIKAEQKYSGMPELAVYCSGLSSIQIEDLYWHYNFDKRKNLFIFGGGIRNREKDVQKYILKNNFTFYGKSPDGKFDNRLPIDKYHEELRNTKYSILIQDEEYNKVGFITWRYYENIAHGVITFIDKKCDKYKIIPLSQNVRDLLTVSSGKELKENIKAFESNKFLRMHVLSSQLGLIKHSMITGEYTYNKLMEM